jgi:hypothetical protein
MNSSRAMIVLCLITMAAFFGRAIAQDTGTEVSGATVVYNSAAVGAQSGSSAYIDASVFYYPGESPDICHVINNILRKQYSGVGYPAAGAVIDARGILEGAGATSCTLNPFDGLSGSFNTTILLPAATIRTACPWILPSGTHIVGEGRGMSGLVLEASFIPSPNNAVIEMGSGGWTNTNCSPNESYICPSVGCTGISIEHLTISPVVPGSTVTYEPYTAIYNNWAGDLSYVDDVVLQNVGQTSTTQTIVSGLYIGGGGSGVPGATYSGPYSNIDFVGSSACGGLTCQYTACVQIQAQTRGLHGITCTAQSQSGNSQPFAAIYLDSYSNTISDVHVEGFYDGVVVGDYQTTGSSIPVIAGNTISNLTVANGAPVSGPVFEAVHICNPLSTTQNTSTACTSISSGWKASDLTDLTIHGVLSNGGGGTPAVSATVLADDLTSTTISGFAGRQFVGSYMLGEPISLNGSSQTYSKLTSAQNAATGYLPAWGVGIEAPSSGSSCTSPGGLFSYTNGAKGTTLWICYLSGSSYVWKSIG